MNRLNQFFRRGGEGIRVALDGLTANRVRSSLTILGVAVGVSVVVALGGAIAGIRASVMSAFESSSPGTFFVNRFDFTSVRLSDVGNGRPPWWNTPEITPREAEMVGRLESVRSAHFSYEFNADVTFEDTRAGSVEVEALSAGWPDYTGGEFTAGRDFTPPEVDEGRALIVLSASLAEVLFGQRDPIGQRVRVASTFRGSQESFRVIGVFQEIEDIFSEAGEHWAIVPWTAASRRLRQSTWQARILVVPWEVDDGGAARDEVIGAMRRIRGLGPRDDNNFATIDSAQLIDLFNRFTGVFFLVMLGLSSAGLLVGGVGVIGIMLISVTERTREIGIRKAVGATRTEILWQFLVEASVLTVLGAAVGLSAGWALSELAATFTPIPAAVPLWSAVAALVMAGVTGMLFGLVPALRASRLDPVVACRFE